MWMFEKIRVLTVKLMSKFSPKILWHPKYVLKKEEQLVGVKKVEP